MAGTEQLASRRASLRERLVISPELYKRVTIAAAGLAFLRRPYRRHLAILGVLLPLGVVGQAVLGGLVVRYDLNPWLVMSHFILSMLLLDASFALAWCAAHEPGWREPSHDRLGTWSVRALVPFGQLTVLVGTMATGAGPHAGEHEGQLVKRLTWQGTETLSWVVQRHAVVAAGRLGAPQREDARVPATAAA